MTRRQVLFLGAAAIAGAILAWVSSELCLRAWLFDGLVVPECPAGQPQATYVLDVAGARRGAAAWITVRGVAHYTTGPSDEDRTAGIGRLAARMSITDPAGKKTPLVLAKDSAADGAGYISGSYPLPEGPDGDWTLSAEIDSPLGPGQATVKVPLYSPARLHLLTDRPLYQAGQTVLARALGLRASDLAPLDGRPGVWRMESPSGEVVLEEKGPLGEWGVAAGSFPLDPEAETGAWSLVWSSGGAEARATFTVEPFVLPRFKLEVSSVKPYYRPGEAPRARGTVRYASGAPVAGARIEVSWTLSGDWPPPNDWLTEALPQRAKTDAAGRFELELPPIPRDFTGRATLEGSLAGTDDTDDRVNGAVSFLLSQDGIRVDAVTELLGGLVEGFNNRVYLRATTPDGVALTQTKLLIKRAWEASDRGISATTDEDGVAAVQLDPGPAVNVVIPPPPYRPPARTPPIAFNGTTDVMTGEAPSLADQQAMDAWPKALAPCARFCPDGGASGVVLGVRVAQSGQIAAVSGGVDALTRCLANGLRPLRLAPGGDHLYEVNLAVADPGLPTLSLDLSGIPEPPPGLAEALDEALRDARPCLSPAMDEVAPLPRLLVWRTTDESRDVRVEWVRDPQLESPALPAATAGCVEQKLARVTLPKATEDGETALREAIGFARIAAAPGAQEGSARPQATTLLGYELSVAAFAGDELIGQTLYRTEPGAVPPVRLRATPVMAKPGEVVEVELIRGPGFTATLPEKLWLRGLGEPIEAPLDQETRRARFTLPADARGWYEVTWGDARALAFVRTAAELALSVRPERERYAPGQTARLAVETQLGGRGVAAAVGLFGVDESLAQLAALPGPDALSGLRPKVNTPQPAFGVLDGQALTLGRIRGANAAQAVIARVGGLPAVEDTDTTVNVSGTASFDPIEALTDHFYAVLGQLHVETRAWESSAPESEKMRPATMAKLFARAVDTLKQKGQPVTDAYGQTLRLSQLPPDLLALCAPQAVVVVGTRLPEDIEDWASWVQKERP